MTDLELMHQLHLAYGFSRRKFHQAREETRPQNGDIHTRRGYGRLLGILADEGELTQRALADRMGIRPQSLTKALVSLEHSGFIVRRSDETDRRQQLVAVTEAGRIRREELLRLRETITAELFSPLTEAEKTTLGELLCKITGRETPAEEQEDSAC